jgi:hypothetical protein
MSQINVNEIYDGNGTDSAKLYGVSMRYGGTNFVNRIINGDMRIDQRNAGASVTANNSVFGVDRWKFQASQTAKGTLQQSTTAPTGFVNSLLFTSSSAYSITSTDFFVHTQNLEGLNISDLAWGTASAAAVTLSFWVRSSLTGTFGGALQNNAQDYNYPFSFSISAANTWEQKTITIAGPTSGTWLSTNGRGINLLFGLGVGSTYSGTAGAWTASNVFSATGATSVVGTSGATFYITGVQLEAGSVATPFERRDYGRELMLCQRYFQAFVIGTYSYCGYTFSSTDARTAFTLMTTMRTAPTGITITGTVQFNSASGGGIGSIVFANASENVLGVQSSGASGLAAGGGSSALRGTGTIQVSTEL